MDPFEYLDGLGMFRMRPGLARIRRLAREMGSPESSIPSVLVAGTNGKGSTCHMAGAIMDSLGFRNLVYTSPHMIDPTERFLLNGSPVPRETLGSALDRVRRIAEDLEEEDRPSYFEALTGAAFHIAGMERVDCLISEVGLGGRYDATNILTPAACAITSISLDHVEVLGEDVRTIAAEKAGIIKPSTPLVLGPMHGSGEDKERVRRSIIGVCSQNGSPVIAFTNEEDNGLREVLEEADIPDWRLVKVRSRTDIGGTVALFSVDAPQAPLQPIPALSALGSILEGEHRTPMIGRHQAFNMGSAISLCTLLAPFAHCMNMISRGRHEYSSTICGDDVSNLIGEIGLERLHGGIRQGLARARVPNRFEIRTPGKGTFILDGGHNPEAAGSISASFRDVHPGINAHLLVAMMRDKDPSGFLLPFEGMIASLTITMVNEERGIAPGRIAEAAAAMAGVFPIIIVPDPERAIGSWMSRTGDGIGIACGTFYLYKLVDRKVPSPGIGHPEETAGGKIT